MELPLKKNEILTAKIQGLTHDGIGVAKVDGFTLFVKNAVPDEEVKVKVIKVNNSFAVARLIETVKTSPKRAEPFCKVFRACGGCSLQHINYQAQLEFKKDRVIQALKRIGRIENVVIHDTIGMKNPTRYRNKAQFPFGMTEEGIISGFFKDRSHEIVKSDSCPVQHESSDAAREALKRFAEDTGLGIYDEKTRKGILRHLMVRVGFKSGEVMVVPVINGERLPDTDRLVELLRASVPGLSSVVVNINRENTNVVLGNRNITIYGKDHIIDYIDNLKFKISPPSFFQVNPLQTEVLYGKVLEYAALKGRETVFDVYCGAGTIALYLSSHAKMVYGIELVKEAVQDAKENAKLNSINNVEFISGLAEIETQKLYEKGIKADVVVVDPPRKGCDGKVLEAIVRMQPQRVVYVSCNPETLARDLRVLEDGGFKAVEVQPVDMFPWTGHVEAIVLMTRSGSSVKK